ncbi:MAG TPA: M28 family peptidase [Ardenticatenaceae bacterium]
MYIRFSCRLAVLSVLLVLLVSLAACGGAGSTAEVSDTAPSATVAAPASATATAEATATVEASATMAAPMVTATETMTATVLEATAVPPLATVNVNTGDVLFEGERAMVHAVAQCEIGPRPAGSEALVQTRDYIQSVLEAEGWTVVRQDGEFMGVPIHNVVGVKGEGAARMVGAHFDTRPVADQDPTSPTTPIIGGNDGASGVAILLELARTLEVPEGRQVQLAFFDAEDRGNLDGWPFSVGAQQMASALPVDRPEAMVVLDMVGDADLQIFRERHSDLALTDVLFATADALGFSENGFYNRDKYTIIDDHLPFLEQGIPAADLIDFDYPYWHTVEDTCDKLGVESLFKVGRVVEVWLEGE